MQIMILLLIGQWLVGSSGITGVFMGNGCLSNINFTSWSRSKSSFSSNSTYMEYGSFSSNSSSVWRNCKTLIDILQGQHIDFNIENICWDITTWSGKLRNCNFFFIRRQNNAVADLLVSKESENAVFYFSRRLLYPPLWLSETLYSDYVTFFNIWNYLLM